MKPATKTAIDVVDAAIRSRKSIRAFKRDPVPTQLLRKIVEIARAAPSHFNSHAEPIGSPLVRFPARPAPHQSFAFLCPAIWFHGFRRLTAHGEPAHRRFRTPCGPQALLPS